MVWSIMAAALFAAVAFNMATKGRKTLSHRMAWIPGSMAAMELAMCGALLIWEYPVLTLILMACRVTVLTCCSLALKKDANAARNRRRRRAVYRHIMADLQRAEQSNVIPLRPCA